MIYKNPVLKGFYPDPSVCFANGKYYLVTSTFQYFPGVALFESDNLVNWKQIGYVLTRPEQVMLDKIPASGGVFAPTIRYNNGRFYMVTTNDTTHRNFYVYTDDIYGEWIEASNIKYSFGLLKVEETSEIPTNVKDAIKYFNRIKEQIFKEWVENVEGNISHIRVAKENEEEYERLRKEITSEFLIGQIAKGNEEVATIKLCVRLESILKHKYGYSGDLFTMLDSFFNGPLKQIETNKPWDDEDINYESQMEEYYRQTELNELHEKWTRYLSKLRMKRNNLVHAEKSSVDFTTEDLKQCINIVEEIDK